MTSENRQTGSKIDPTYHCPVISFVFILQARLPALSVSLDPTTTRQVEEQERIRVGCVDGRGLLLFCQDFLLASFGLST